MVAGLFGTVSRFFSGMSERKPRSVFDEQIEELNRIIAGVGPFVTEKTARDTYVKVVRMRNIVYPLYWQKREKGELLPEQTAATGAILIATSFFETCMLACQYAKSSDTLLGGVAIHPKMPLFLRRIALEEPKCESEIGRGSSGEVYLYSFPEVGFFASKEISLIDASEEKKKNVCHECMMAVLSSSVLSSGITICTWILPHKAVIVSDYAGKAFAKVEDRIRPKIDHRELLCSLLRSCNDLHFANIFHNDLNTHNFCLYSSGKGIVIDFGKADFGKEKWPVASVYEPFEVICEGKRYLQSDTWSIGVLLLEMITGGLPWTQVQIGRLGGVSQEKFEKHFKIIMREYLRDKPRSELLSYVLTNLLVVDPLKRKLPGELLRDRYFLFDESSRVLSFSSSVEESRGTWSFSTNSSRESRSISMMSSVESNFHEMAAEPALAVEEEKGIDAGEFYRRFKAFKEKKNRLLLALFREDGSSMHAASASASSSRLKMNKESYLKVLEILNELEEEGKSLASALSKEGRKSLIDMPGNQLKTSKSVLSLLRQTLQFHLALMKGTSEFSHPVIESPIAPQLKEVIAAIEDGSSFAHDSIVLDESSEAINGLFRGECMGNELFFKAYIDHLTESRATTVGFQREKEKIFRYRLKESNDSLARFFDTSKEIRAIIYPFVELCKKAEIFASAGIVFVDWNPKKIAYEPESSTLRLTSCTYSSFLFNEKCWHRAQENVFCAPEVLFNGSRSDPNAAAVWSIGLVFFAGITGRFPWDESFLESGDITEQTKVEEKIEQALLNTRTRAKWGREIRKVLYWLYHLCLQVDPTKRIGLSKLRENPIHLFLRVPEIET